MGSVIAPNRKDPLDQLAKGLEVAQRAFGIYSDYRGIKNMNAAEDAAAASKEDQNNAVITEPEKAGLLAKGFEPTTKPEEAQLTFNQKKKDGSLTPVYLKLPKSATPRYSNVTTDEGVFAVNTANPTDKIRLGAAPPRLGAHGTAPASPNKKDTVVPGFESDPSVNLSPVEVKDARNALATYSTIASNLDELKSYVAKNGSFQFFGPDGARMKQIATMTRLQMKEMANLGVLSVTDYKFLDSMLQDPSSAGALFTRNETAISQIDELKKQTELKFLNGMMSKGFKLTDQPAPGAITKPPGRAPSLSPYANATASPAAKPKTVNQNGVIYNWNEKAGKYE